VNRDDQMLILQLRAELSEIDARVNAIFHELDELGVFDISTITDARQQTLNALAADNLP
jgi:hypothetical protein